MKTTAKPNRQILDEASEWFVDFRVGDVNEHSRERFDEWLRRSPEHIRAYIEIARTYVEMPNPHGTKPLDVEALIAYARSGETVVPFSDAGHGQPNAPRALAAELKFMEQPTKRAQRSPRLRRRILAAASCALVLMVAGAVWWNVARYPLYATDIGERRSITLADGSTVDLNARSRLRIEFSQAERRVLLLEGQALFQVSKDKNRPFIVRSGNATVRAVGTQFDVNRNGSGTTVTVLEGRVAVYSGPPVGPTTMTPAPHPTAGSPHASALPQTAGHLPIAPLSSSHSAGSPPSPPAAPERLLDPSGSAAIILSAGEQVTVTPAAVVPAPVHADIGATTAWMERRLIFEGSKLSVVVQEFNRYNKRQLVIEGDQLSGFHVSGVYSSSDPASLIRFLRDQPGIEIVESATEVQISAR